MTLTCKLSKSDESVLIHLCEGKLLDALEKDKLTPAQTEEQLQVYEVYNKLVLGLDYEGIELQTPTRLQAEIRHLAIITLARLQEIDIAGSVDLLFEDSESVIITVFARHGNLESRIPRLYTLVLEVVEDHILIEAQSEMVEHSEYYKFLTEQLERELEDDLL